MKYRRYTLGELIDELTRIAAEKGRDLTVHVGDPVSIESDFAVAVDDYDPTGAEDARAPKHLHVQILVEYTLDPLAEAHAQGEDFDEEADEIGGVAS